MGRSNGGSRDGGGGEGGGGGGGGGALIPHEKSIVPANISLSSNSD